MLRPGPIAVLLMACCTLAAGAAPAAMFNGRNVDDKWYEGRCVSTTYGAYRCQIKFNGDRAFFRPEGTSIQIVGIMEDETINDPHEILVNDPKRGVNWTLEVINLPQ